MTVEDVLELLEREVAPVKVSDDLCAKYNMYDNSGIIINCGKEVTGAIFSLDLTNTTADFAIENGYNLIITHHPAIYGGISRFDLKNGTHARALAKCIKHDISVISMHLNFDAAPEGIDYHLMKGLGGDEKSCQTLENVEGGAYGRVYGVAPTEFAALTNRIGKTFSALNVTVHGNYEKEIHKIASFCGAGCNDRAVEFAKSHGADLFVSSDMSHHHIVELVESGIAVIQLTHFTAEDYGFNKIFEKVKDKLQFPSKYLTNALFL